MVKFNMRSIHFQTHLFIYSSKMGIGLFIYPLYNKKVIKRNHKNNKNNKNQEPRHTNNQPRVSLFEFRF